MSFHRTTVAWTDLSGPARTLLSTIARRDRDGDATTRSDIRDALSDAHHPKIADQDLLTACQTLEEAELIEAEAPLAPYEVTTTGRDLLTSQLLRLESVTEQPAVEQVDALAVCPRCGKPITELTTTTAGDLTTSFCECQLADPSLDSAVSRLLEVYPVVADRDAAHYLRQAIYLLLPRADE